MATSRRRNRTSKAVTKKRLRVPKITVARLAADMARLAREQARLTPLIVKLTAAVERLADREKGRAA